jgi:ribonuclease BN (tRNA processing enzyme)
MPKLTTIGTGDAFSSGGRFQSCFHIEWEGPTFLVDCGANAFLNLKRSIVNLDRIQTIFITHFHGDHYGGIPFILLDRKFSPEARSKLEIYGPAGVKERIRNLSECLYPGLGDELVAQENLKIENYSSSEYFEVGEIRILPLPVIHAPDSLPHGLRIELGEKVLAFSGDTEWNGALVELADNADLMMLECNSFSSIVPGHCSYSQMKENADRLKVEKLVLNHFGPEMLANKEGVEISMASDGEEFEF